jgi:outer membrane immunogenic protein
MTRPLAETLTHPDTLLFILLSGEVELLQRGLGMSKRAFASAAIVGIALVDAVPAAAQVDYVAPNYYTNDYNWTGFYIGANIGGWNTRADYSGGLVGSVSRSSVLGGFYGGYNYQYGNLVLGTEGTFDLTDICTRFDGLRSETRWTGSAVLRAGYVINDVMLYGGGGVAVTDQALTFPRLPEYNTRTGWTAIAGIEFRLGRYVIGKYPTDRSYNYWIARVEYRHADFGTVNNFRDLDSKYVSDAVLFGVSIKTDKIRA